MLCHESGTRAGGKRHTPMQVAIRYLTLYCVYVHVLVHTAMIKGSSDVIVTGYELEGQSSTLDSVRSSCGNFRNSSRKGVRGTSPGVMRLERKAQTEFQLIN